MSSLQYAYVRAKVTIDGTTLTDVGLRPKGNSSYTTAQEGIYIPFKLDFNRFVPGQRYLGLTCLNLHNNAFDESRLREHLSYQVFREANLPASRTSFAKVFLTIPGKYDRHEIGIYSIVEEVDKDFIKTRFPSGKGLLMKPETVTFGLRDMGDDWNAYIRTYQPRSEATPKQARRVIEFVQLVEKADDKTFADRIESYLNIDQFLRHLAVHTVTANLDSILCIGHNYFVYLNATDDRLYFIPWDMNLSFGAWVWLGAPEDLVNLSLYHPHVGDNKFIDRILAMESYQEIYRRHIVDLLATTLAPDKLEKQIDELDKLIRPDGKPLPNRKGRDWNIKVPPLRDFPRKRAEAVQAQLNGAEGYRPSIRLDRIFNLPPNPALKAASKVPSPTTKPSAK
jgi:spore coat protein CotH